jgi:hypothetical protein
MMTRRTAAAAIMAAFILGGIASHYMPRVSAQTEVKAPNWRYGLNTRVRKGDEADFSRETRKIGIEVYRDENNGNLIYVSESGSIAVVPAK